MKSECVSFLARRDLPMQQRVILEVLRVVGEATRGEVTELLGYRPRALRSHFAALLAAGEVCERVDRPVGHHGGVPPVLFLPGGSRGVVG